MCFACWCLLVTRLLVAVMFVLLEVVVFVVFGLFSVTFAIVLIVFKFWILFVRG